tara:strand:- start:608 stop:802 length:195 start_codon:yes stop_codon:yes gene_type:complete
MTNKITYNPNNPMSESELEKLGKENFELFLKYLDAKAEYLKTISKPLRQYHTKVYKALTQKTNK